MRGVHRLENFPFQCSGGFDSIEPRMFGKALGGHVRVGDDGLNGLKPDRQRDLGVGRGLYLARQRPEGWVRLATGSEAVSPSESTVHGHVIGIFWRH